MAERSQFWTTNNTGHGPSSGYASDRWRDMLRKVFQSDRVATGSVLFGVDNQLAVTGASAPLSINTGAAFAYGFFYENDAAKSLAVTTPVVGTTGGRVILRADFAAQTVTAIVNRNTDGVSAIPALVQTPGTTYDVPIATFTITTGNVVTLTDVREFAKYAFRLYGSQLDPAIVDNATLEIAANVLRVKDAGVTAAKLATNAVTTVKVTDLNITTAKIADLGVTLAKLAADSVDDTKAGNRVPQFYRRQGGSASDWSSFGSTTQTPTSVRMQAGAHSTVAGFRTITFPVAFSQPPLVYATPGYGVGRVILLIGPVTASNVEIQTMDASGASIGANFNWFAVGPE